MTVLTILQEELAEHLEFQTEENMRAGMSPGGAKAGSSTSMIDRNGDWSAAELSQAVRSASVPSQARSHSCSSHRPITLRR